MMVNCGNIVGYIDTYKSVNSEDNHLYILIYFNMVKRFNMLITQEQSRSNHIENIVFFSS